MTTLSFRLADRASPADALCIGILGMQVFLDTYATHGIRPLIAREVLAEIAPPAVQAMLDAGTSRFVLAEIDAHLVGFAQHAGAELQRLYVQRRFHGRGVGSALLAHVEADAHTAGHAELRLTAWVGNAHALAWYPKRGFQDRGSTQYRFEDEAFENRIFAKPLG